MISRFAGAARKGPNPKPGRSATILHTKSVQFSVKHCNYSDREMHASNTPFSATADAVIAPNEQSGNAARICIADPLTRPANTPWNRFDGCSDFDANRLWHVSNQSS